MNTDVDLAVEPPILTAIDEAGATGKRHRTVFLRNIAANLAGRGWSMLMNFAFVPIYIKLLGIESYGVIAFYATLGALFSFLDLGLSATLSRELARRTGSRETLAPAHDVVRTLETIYWAIGLSVSLIVVLAAPFIATHWLNAKGLSDTTLTNAIRLMGLVIALHWPSGLYAGGLSGLQKQVYSNGLDIAFSTARGIGAVSFIFFVSRTVESFFVWQLIISGATVVTLRTVLMRQLGPAARPARFSRQVLTDTWRFAGSMSGLSIVSIILMYTDKVVLSAMLPLAVYARYMLANTLAAASAMFAFAVFGAIYPRLTQLVAAKAHAAIEESYHFGTQLIALAVVPMAAIVGLFSHELLFFWTTDAALAANAAPITSLLVIGTALNSLMMMPYALQLAHGSTRLNIIANIISIIVLVPATYFLTRAYGPIGAATLLPAQNIGYMLFLAVATHRRFLPAVTVSWYVKDIAPPVAAALIVALVGRILVPSGLGQFQGFLLAGCVGVPTLLAAALATEQGRTFARRLSRGASAGDL